MTIHEVSSNVGLGFSMITYTSFDEHFFKFQTELTHKKATYSHAPSGIQTQMPMFEQSSMIGENSGQRLNIA
jgi:hypothetical protein